MVGLRLGLGGNWRPTQLGVTREARLGRGRSWHPANQPGPFGAILKYAAEVPASHVLHDAGAFRDGGRHRIVVSFACYDDPRAEGLSDVPRGCDLVEGLFSARSKVSRLPSGWLLFAPSRQNSDLSSQARHFFLERDDFGSPVEQLDTAPSCRPYYECECNQASDRIVAHDSPASVSVVTVLSPAECNAIRYQRAAPSRKRVTRIEAVLTNGGQGILRVAVA